MSETCVFPTQNWTHRYVSNSWFWINRRFGEIGKLPARCAHTVHFGNDAASFWTFQLIWDNWQIAYALCTYSSMLQRCGLILHVWGACFNFWTQMQRGSVMAPFWHGCSTGPACWHALTFEFNIDAFTHWIQMQGTAKHESLALEFKYLKNGSMLHSNVRGCQQAPLHWHPYIYIVCACCS